MIRVQCMSNVDRWKTEDWATQLPAVPVVGQHMLSRRGIQLKITKLTWDHCGVLLIELDHELDHDR